MVKKLQKENGSKHPRKQRKNLYNLSLHAKGKLMNVLLSQDLRKKYSFRNLRVRKGDKVKIISGQHKGKSGKVENISLNNLKVSVNGIETIKKDGTKSYYKFHPSNLMITELDLSDRRRLKRNKKTDKKETKTESKEKVEDKKEVKPKVESKEKSKTETKENSKSKINNQEAKK